MSAGTAPPTVNAARGWHITWSMGAVAVLIGPSPRAVVVGRRRRADTLVITFA